jgi:anti-sigma factor RsiW
LSSQDETAACPSVLDVACLESGDLSDLRRAAVRAHSRRCARCGASLADLKAARNEILGPTPAARSTRSRRAAEEIQNLLRRRLH